MFQLYIILDTLSTTYFFMPKFLFLKSLVKFPQIPKIFTQGRVCLGNQGLFLNFDMEFLFVPLKFPKNVRFVEFSKTRLFLSPPPPRCFFVFTDKAFICLPLSGIAQVCSALPNHLKAKEVNELPLNVKDLIWC